MQLASVIEAEGFALGEALGRIARAAVPALQGSADWHALAAWRGSDAIRSLMQRARSAFPEYWEELRGISAGIELDLEDVFLWNCRQDLVPDAVGTSSAIAVNRLASRCVMFSSEASASLRAHAGVIELRRPDKPVLVSLYFPGCLAGFGWGWNKSSGVAQAVVPFSSGDVDTGLPGAFLGRAILDAPDLAGAVDMLDGLQRCGGAHHVLASNHEFVMLAISASASGSTLSSIPGKAIIDRNGSSHGSAVPDRRLNGDRMLFEHLPRHASREDLLQALMSSGGKDGSGRMMTLLSLTPESTWIDGGIGGDAKGWYRSSPLQPVGMER